ncbi:MAG: hypothetical protein ABSG54_08590, partial [Terriglobia bacterium]
MLSTRLVRLIEDHAEELTRGVLNDLQTNTCTPSYHKLSREQLHHRVYTVYRNLGVWLGHAAEESIEAAYCELGQTRHAEGIPLSEVIYALGLT